VLYDPKTGLPIRSTPSLGKRADWMESFLQKCGHSPAEGTPLHKALADARELVRLTRVDEKIEIARARGILRNALGLSFLCALIEQASQRSGFERLERLLPALCRGDPVAPKTAGHSMERSLSFEFEVGCLCLLAGYEVISRSEPDLELREENTIWAIACKVIYGASDLTLCDRVEEGIRQTTEANADFRMIFLGVSERLRHDALLPIEGAGEFGPFHGGDANKQVVREAGEVVRVLRAAAATRFLRGREDPRFRGLFTVAHAVAGMGAVPSMETNIALLDRSYWFDPASVSGPESELLRRIDCVIKSIEA
jgi:hypothetical protein